MKIDIDNFTIKAFDSLNFALYEDKEVKKGQGRRKVLIGYFSTLAGAIKRIVNIAVLSSQGIYDTQELLSALKRIETRLNERFKGVKPKDFDSGEEL